MKTFEEVLNTMPVTCLVDPDDRASPSDVEERDRLTRSHEFYGRYSAIADEAHRSAVMNEMLLGWLLLAKTDPSSALFSAFMTGLIVGMEMEKQ